jgi:glutamine synthetase
MLCDEYFNSGVPYPFSPRQLLRAQLRRLEEKGMAFMVGLEVEWYLLEAVEEHLTEEHLSIPGIRGQPLATRAPEPGYSYHSESNMDLMQPVLSALAEAYDGLGLGLRSMENEWGPGQVECTFAPKKGLAAADDVVLFRTATKQICRRMGHVATFMCRPALKGYYSSGWHLHQSLVEAASGANVLTPEGDGALLSPMGMNYLGGLVTHAVAYTAFTTPTVNGYRRFRPNSLAPDRVCWAFDHRGVMLRVLGAEGDPASRIENRIGEPAANPYLYMASQVAAGLDGIDNALDPGPADDEPYAADRTMLPKDLGAALDALEDEPLFRTQFGDVFMDYYLKLKRNELGRFLTFLDEQGTTLADTGDETTDWEQNEYFDFF